jgi:protein-tyrosine phosphatase
MDAPTPESYWVEPGLLAGKYPGLLDLTGTGAKVDQLLAAGVTLFVDLTEEFELDPYAHLVGERALHVRMPISDMDVTTVEQMRRTLDLIDRERARHGTAYVHCWGGAGRTGTVVGCWLVRHGLDGDAALRRIAALRADSPALWLDSPQTEAQHAMVRGWSEAH